MLTHCPECGSGEPTFHEPRGTLEVRCDNCGWGENEGAYDWPDLSQVLKDLRKSLKRPA